MTDDSARLRELTDELLARDADTHAEALATLREVGDERVVPHLVDLVVIDAIANDWGSFGFPEVLRERDPPRYLELPEVRWPGVRAALSEITGQSFDTEYAWVEWETWYSQREVEPLAGYDDWKLRLYRSFLPPVGALLDAEPRAFDLRDVRWGNCDSAFLAALNAPEFVPGDAVSVDGDGGSVDGGGEGEADGSLDGNGGEEAASHDRYLAPDDVVFGFEVDGQAYAVSRQVLFPHEMLNATLDGVPVSLTYCTLCNAPILYDRRVGDRTLTFGNSGMLLAGNKLMYDEETRSLWNQHRGVPLAGEHLEADATLENRVVVQTEWADWRREHPDTLALPTETGYGYDYGFYDGDLGIFRHYWESEGVVQPGVRREESELPEKEPVYAITGDGGEAAVVFPVAAVEEAGVLAAGDDRAAAVDGDRAAVDGERAAGGEGAAALDEDPVVATVDPAGDVAVYAAPPLPVERDGDALVDADGRRWAVGSDGLAGPEGATRGRVAGRRGLWFAFRVHYPETTVVDAR